MILNDKQSIMFSRWLIACMTMVVIMVFIGGVTRLTESGLSIVEWKVFSGTFPPLSQEAWLQEFDDYKQTPEFQKINSYFELADFKRIYWLEYIHRLLGRITGLVFALPLIYFALRKTLPAKHLWRMTGVSLLVGMQGLFGWIMVKSGLQDDPYVNPLKLALHLCTAFLIFSLLCWQWLNLKRDTSTPSPLSTGLTWFIPLTLALLILQIIFGAFVAGYDAGMIYNTYPLMDGQWVPQGLMALEPWWRSHIEHIPMVQFQHRILAKLLTAAILVLAVICWRTQSEPVRRAVKWLLLILFIQFILGVSTLIYEVPIALASLHQLGALALLGAFLLLKHKMLYHTPAKVRT